MPLAPLPPCTHAAAAHVGNTGTVQSAPAEDLIPSDRGVPDRVTWRFAHGMGVITYVTECPSCGAVVAQTVVYPRNEAGGFDMDLGGRSPWFVLNGRT